MKNNHSKISFLVLVFLLVFLNPLFIKSFHTLEDHKHQHDTDHFEKSDDTVISHPHDFCPIYEYELSVNDIPDLKTPDFSGLEYSERVVFQSGQVLFKHPVTLFSPRAPPSFS